MKRPARIAALCVALLGPTISVANPLSLVTETYSQWKERLFGGGHPTPSTVNAPPTGAVSLQPGQPLRVRIVDATPEREFPKGKSRFRIIELPQELDHAIVRVQVTAQNNEEGHGNAVFKPVLYVLDESDKPREPVEFKPLHLDIRPFRRTRLLGCVRVDKVQRLAIATTPDALGKSYESDVRDAVKAPTQGGFYYATDAVKVKLPFAPTGNLVIDITADAGKDGEGC